MDISILILIIIILIIGNYLLINGRLLPKIDGFENNSGCPDLLIQNGEQYFLYNSKAPTEKGKNPISFSKLSDYANFVSANPSCPVLFLQKGNDTQGKDTYTVRGGTPMNTSTFNGMDQTAPLANANGTRGGNNNNLRTVPLVDSTLQNPPYNAYNKPGYAAFDPYGFDIGRFNPLDAIHISGELLPVSDSPTDPNWGGPEYTTQIVNSGKYVGNEVYRPIFSGGHSVGIR
jgi:hypothetical protein